MPKQDKNDKNIARESGRLRRKTTDSGRSGEGLRWTKQMPVPAARKKPAVTKSVSKGQTLYRMLVDAAKDVIFTVDLSLKYTFVSPSVTDLLGYSVDEIMEKNPLDLLTPASRQYALRVLAEEIALETPTPRYKYYSRVLELEQFHKDGTFRWVEITMTFLRGPDGRPTGILGISRDITNRKRAEEGLKASIREKEILLQEIHHRVKNNLQIVSSLLRLQSRHAHDKAYEEMLSDSQNRLQSMALIHENLYRSRDVAEVNFDGYIGRLAAYLFRSYGIGPEKITLKIDAEPVSLPVNTAIPCGLIANELISNCFKHAFPDGNRGTVEIGVASKGEWVHLAVCDDGVGLPEGFDVANLRTLGLRLVNRLIKQLHGEVTVQSDGKRTEFRFRFPSTGSSDPQSRALDIDA